MLASLSTGSGAQATITEEEAHAIGVDAYLYFYPLVTMDVTRKQLTNQEPRPGGIGGPMNSFANVGAFPTADMRVVVRPNFDTLYSSGWLDLTKEPMVVSVPDTGGRYYLLPMLDMWTDVFASPGWRTTGTQSGQLPGHAAGLEPERFPTASRGSMRRRPMSGSSAAPRPTAPPTTTPCTRSRPATRSRRCRNGARSRWRRRSRSILPIDMKTPPKIQVDTMPAAKFFAYAAELLKLHPPHITDQPIIAQLKRIGFEVGKSFDLDKADPAVQAGASTSAPEDAQKLMAWKMPTLARVANGWSMNTDTMGVYGNYYLKRAHGHSARARRQSARGRDLSAEPRRRHGKPLDGANNYTIHFDKGQMPPVEAFWSITLYDNDGFQVANPLNRFAVSSWMPFKYNPDGSLDLYFQNESPGADKEANWLPAPKGPFNLTMRLYAPKSDALTGKWNPPPVVKEQATPLAVQ